MTKKLITRASLEAAVNRPYETLEALFAGRNLGAQIHDILNGRSPLAVFGAEAAGENPAGTYARHDLVPQIPGLRGTTVDGQNVNEIWMEAQAMLAAFNAAANRVANLLSFETVRANERVGVPTNPGFQKATEFGRPTRVRVTHVARGFPLDHFDLGEGHTQEYIDNSTGAELLAVTATILNAWAQLEKEVVMEAVFGAANYTDKDGINVKRLYNADGEVPPTIKRWTHDGTHTHYLSSAGASFAQADLDTMSDHLIHHGFREFGDDTEFRLHVHRDDLPAVRAFTDFIPAETAERPVEMGSTGIIVGSQRGGGDRLEGWCNDWSIYQDNDMVSGYLFGFAAGGFNNPRNVVGRRVHENPSARNLRLIEGNRQNYPLYDSVYDGYIGAGVGQRGAAVVMEEGTDPYTSPTFSTGD